MSGSEWWILGAYLLGTVVGYIVFWKTQTEKTVLKTLRVLEEEGVIILDEETGTVSPAYRDEQWDALYDELMRRIDEEEEEAKDD
jgi:hypothetical protein